MNLYYEEHNGSMYRTSKTTHVVSRWFVTYDAHEYAKPVIIFFNNEEEAKAYAADFAMPPEMADAYTIAFYDKCAMVNVKSYADYKKRFYKDFAEEDRP